MLTLAQPDKAFRYSVDAVLLAATVPLKDDMHILDAGSGVGALGLHIARRAQKHHNIYIDFCENEPLYYNYCTQNIAQYSTPSVHMNLIKQDILTVIPSNKQYDFIATNPPFYIADSVDASPHDMVNKAKIISRTNFRKWCLTVLALLKPKAKMSLIMRPDDLHELYHILPQSGVECFILPLIDYGKPVANRLIIGLKIKRGSKAPPKTYMHPHLTLHNAEGQYTKVANTLLFDYHFLDLWR